MRSIGRARRIHSPEVIIPNRQPSKKAGNFDDFDMLFEQLATPAVMELGFPLPKEKFMPRRRAGSCPASHNRARLGEDA
jgi:hypothetical protein